MQRLGILAVLLTLCAAATTAQTLPDAAIEAAIRAGVSRHYDQLIVTCTASTGAGGGAKAAFGKGVESLTPFDVTIAANAGQIALLAAEATRLYKPFTRADVPDDLTQTPTVTVTANPRRPGVLFGRVTAAAAIERIVLKSKAHADRVVQPSAFENEPVSFNVAHGGQVESTRGIATFSLALVNDLPKGDVEIIIVTHDAERKCHIDDGERRRLFITMTGTR